MAVPYFISFRAYGTWLHGDVRGSVDRTHNVPGTPLLPPDAGREAHEQELMAAPPADFSPAQRRVIESTIREVCDHRGWQLFAVNPRTNHVHSVVAADQPPERVMNDFKAYATRRLVQAALAARRTPLWARHGSTRYLDTTDSFKRAVQYVLEEQDNRGRHPPGQHEVYAAC